MQIQVKCSCGAESCPEWAMVELQGTVEVQPAFQDRLQDLVIGQLCRPSSEKYTFTIGYHELTGTKVTLKKPLLVLKKVKHMDVDHPAHSSPNVHLDVVGIIRHKILFKTRPKAIISKVASTCPGNSSCHFPWRCHECVCCLVSGQSKHSGTCSALRGFILRHVHVRQEPQPPVTERPSVAGPTN